MSRYTGSFTALIGTWGGFFGQKGLTWSGLWNTRNRFPGLGWIYSPGDKKVDRG